MSAADKTKRLTKDYLHFLCNSECRYTEFACFSFKTLRYDFYGMFACTVEALKFRTLDIVAPAACEIGVQGSDKLIVDINIGGTAAFVYF